MIGLYVGNELYKVLTDRNTKEYEESKREKRFEEAEKNPKVRKKSDYPSEGNPSDTLDDLNRVRDENRNAGVEQVRSNKKSKQREDSDLRKKRGRCSYD